MFESLFCECFCLQQAMTAVSKMTRTNMLIATLDATVPAIVLVLMHTLPVAVYSR